MTNDLLTVKNEFLREEYHKIVHKSGLNVYIFPKNLSTTYASITVRFGSLDNTFRFSDEDELLVMPDGIAHFLEHKMFESEDHVDTFDKFAAVGASANAYTSNEVTYYLFTTPTDVEEPLKILLDYVFHPYFTDKNVEKEVGIVGQEIKMYSDSPGSRLYHSMMQLMYQNHGIRTDICGTMETISEITPALLNRCHSAFYRPENMFLIVCGNVEVDRILSVVDAVIPTFPPQTPVVLDYPEEPAAILRKRAEFHMDIARPKLCVGIKDTHLKGTPKEQERRAIAINMLCDLYFGESTPFYERLYSSGLISRDFSAYYESLRDCGHLLCGGATDEPERLLAAIREEFARIVADPTALAADLDRIKRVHYAEFIKDFDDTEEIASALLDAVLEETELFEAGSVILSIELPEIYEIAKELFCEDALVYTVIHPMKGRNTSYA